MKLKLIIITVTMFSFFLPSQSISQPVYLEGADAPMGRLLERYGNSDIHLYSNEIFNTARPRNVADPWIGEWEQNDPVVDGNTVPNACGPVAARNLINWFGQDYNWDILVQKLRTNTTVSVGTAMELCLPIVTFPVYYSACTTFLSTYNISGTWQRHLTGTLSELTPDGYTLHQSSGIPNLIEILYPLSAGYPVIVLINTDPHVNHYVVVTGIEWHTSANDYWLLLANKNPGGMYWKDFKTRWSLENFCDPVERTFFDYAGEKAYPIWYYARSELPPFHMLPEIVQLNYDCPTVFKLLNPGKFSKFSHSTKIGSTDFCIYAGISVEAGLEWSVNRRGHDYKNFWIATPDPSVCRRECIEDSKCLAFTYVEPGIQGTSARCWLKNVIPGQSVKPGTVSDIVRSGFEVDVDRLGHDYTSFTTDDAATCRDKCIAQEKCQSYTYRNEDKRCWLKNDTPNPRRKKGVTSGLVRHDGFEYGVDRHGSDYQNIWLLFPDPSACKKACMDDSRCKAFTYLEPGFQGSNPRCWLKDERPMKSFLKQAVSGTNFAISDTGSKPGPSQTEYHLDESITLPKESIPLPLEASPEDLEDLGIRQPKPSPDEHEFGDVPG